MTKNGILWKWENPEERAFWELERSLITTPVLHMPDFDRPFIVTTDASAISVGAILEQDFGQGLKPIAFEIQKLNLQRCATLHMRGSYWGLSGQ